MENEQGAFVFTQDGDVEFFRTVSEAAGYVEAVDVANGEYVAFFSLAGERLDPEIVDDTYVELRPTGVIDLNTRHSCLGELQSRNGFTSDPADPVAVANEILTRRWEIRWPRWPSWLDRRLHGEAPPRA